MANRTHEPVLSRSSAVRKIVGRFRPNGSSAVDNDLNKGHGFTVTRTGTGAFRIALDENYVELIHADFQLWATAAAGGVGDIRVVSETVASNGRVNIEHTIGVYAVGAVDTATATDISSDAASWISFELTLRDSGAT